MLWDYVDDLFWASMKSLIPSNLVDVTITLPLAPTLSTSQYVTSFLDGPLRYKSNFVRGHAMQPRDYGIDQLMDMGPIDFCDW